MDIKKIIMPDGKMRTYYCGDDQTWSDIIRDVVLPDWMEYCSSHWISANHEAMYAPEKRVKAFLDRCGWMLLQDNPAGLESKYKEMVHLVKEIPVTECPAAVSDYLYSAQKPPIDEDENDRFTRLCERLDEKMKNVNSKKTPPKKETRFTRIEKIIKASPNSKRTWCIVDADSSFEYNGIRYKIPVELEGYEGEEKNLMDRVFVVEDASSLRFYDQNVMNVYVVA